MNPEEPEEEPTPDDTDLFPMEPEEADPPAVIPEPAKPAPTHDHGEPVGKRPTCGLTLPAWKAFDKRERRMSHVCSRQLGKR